MANKSVEDLFEKERREEADFEKGEVKTPRLRQTQRKESSYEKSRKDKKRERRKRKKARQLAHPALYNFLDWVKVIVIAVVVALFLNFFVMINSRVPSGSMEPTIVTGSRMIGFRLSYTFNDPERGDIIIFKYPDDESVYYVKRIIGLPGETIEIKDGFVYVDGVILVEDYLTVTTEGNFGPYVVPEGSYFVMGDNRNNSHDSRYWENTYVPEENILGKAVLCYWPISNIGLLE